MAPCLIARFFSISLPNSEIRASILERAVAIRVCSDLFVGITTDTPLNIFVLIEGIARPTATDTTLFFASSVCRW